MMKSIAILLVMIRSGESNIEIAQSDRIGSRCPTRYEQESTVLHQDNLDGPSGIKL